MRVKSKTLKTMGSLHAKKPSLETRLGPNVPVHSRLKCYEKPGRAKRCQIVVQDCWRKLRNWSAGRDTEKMSRDGEAKKLAKVPREKGWEAMAHRGHVRKDSKMDTCEEPLKRRKSSLFLDVESTDASVAGS